MTRTPHSPRTGRTIWSAAVLVALVGLSLVGSTGCRSGWSGWGAAKPRPISIDELPPPPTSFASQKPAKAETTPGGYAATGTSPSGSNPGGSTSSGPAYAAQTAAASGATATVASRPDAPASPYGKEPQSGAPYGGQPSSGQSSGGQPYGNGSATGGATSTDEWSAPASGDWSAPPSGSTNNSRPVIRGQSPSWDRPRVAGQTLGPAPSQVMPSTGPHPRIAQVGPPGYGGQAYGAPLAGSPYAAANGYGRPVPFGVATQTPPPVPPTGMIPASPVPYGVAPSLPVEAWTGPPTSIEQWRPPGIAGPWPADEYLHDGGDRAVEASIAPDLSVYGLDAEDTIALGDNEYGQTVKSASNRVTLYAPRFAAVRQVRGLVATKSTLSTVDVDQPIGPNMTARTGIPTAATQPIEVIASRGQKNFVTLRDLQSPGRLGGLLPVETFVNEFSAFENLLVIRTGGFDQTEAAVLMKGREAAEIWQDNLAVRVIVDGDAAVEQRGLAKAEETKTYDRFGKPAIRIVKLADKRAANPGDVVNFTLRYDNVGADPLTNVAILDNLTTRLTYVVDSTQSNREAVFAVQENEAQSLILKWTLTEPLPPRPRRRDPLPVPGPLTPGSVAGGWSLVGGGWWVVGGGWTGLFETVLLLPEAVGWVKRSTDPPSRGFDSRTS